MISFQNTPPAKPAEADEFETPSKSTFLVGLKLLRCLVERQSPLAWHKAKLTEELFKCLEVEVFKWVDTHLAKYHALPQLATFDAQWPESAIDCKEPPAYYLDLLSQRFAYDQINRANIESQALLKSDKSKVVEAEALLSAALSSINEQKYRLRLMNVGLEVPKLVMLHYHDANVTEGRIVFGWPTLDAMWGGAMAGDIVSFVGRPAAGKSYLALWLAILNWRKGRTILFVSMEMAPLPVANRIAAIYTSTNVGMISKPSLPNASFLGKSAQTQYKKFVSSLFSMQTEQAEFYVIDGNLAAHVDDLYMLAAHLKCDAVFIDGAYLLRHKNTRLDRFTRVSENVELMKRHTSDLEIPTFASWQFNRNAAKKPGKEKAGLEDIAFSDAIPQISSIALGLFEEEGVETMQSRSIDIMKGRGGEIGTFRVKWDFNKMDFSEVQNDSDNSEPLQYL